MLKEQPSSQLCWLIRDPRSNCHRLYQNLNVLFARAIKRRSLSLPKISSKLISSEPTTFLHTNFNTLTTEYLDIHRFYIFFDLFIIWFYFIFSSVSFYCSLLLFVKRTEFVDVKCIWRVWTIKKIKKGIKGKKNTEPSPTKPNIDKDNELTL